MDPLLVLLDIVQTALIGAVPGVAGRVYLRRTIPRQTKEASFLQISLGGGEVEAIAEAPPLVRRTETVNITAVAKGDSQEACRKILAIREEVVAIMREIQAVPGLRADAPCLIDEVRPASESELETVSNGAVDFSGRTLMYEAVYVTEEGTPGLAGPCIPEFNVLEAYKTALANWKPYRKGQLVLARDSVDYEEEQA